MTVKRETFYQQIAQNKRRSILLVIVIGLILSALGYFLGLFITGDATGALVFIPISIAVTAVIALAAYYSGDSLVLSASGAREVTEQTAPQLVNVVREMSLAANVPQPRVYIIDDSAPNAFATGRDPEHASVAVTTGLLEKLDREELQGVLAHELSHVQNYDIRFSLLVGVMVGSIALLSDVIARSAFWGGMGRGSRRESGGAGAILLIVGLVVAILAPIFARLVQMAVNRQREFLADATSVELTRNPYGLERALAKIAGDQEPLEVANRATQHLYIVNPIKKLDSSAMGLFSTHPAIVDRINRLRRMSGQPELDDAGVRSLAGLS